MGPRRVPFHRQTPRLSSRPIDLGAIHGNPAGEGSASAQMDTLSTEAPHGSPLWTKERRNEAATKASPPTAADCSASTTLAAGLPVPDGTERIAPHCLFDLVIIGAGPSALAVLARILETRPAALYTEEEHHFLHWLKRSRGSREGNQRRNFGSAQGPANKGLRVVKTVARGSDRVIVGEKLLPQSVVDDPAVREDGCECPGEMRILVLDKLGDGWLANWNRLFKALQIKHLRSPLFFHPCPADLDSLLAFAQRSGRTKAGDASYAFAGSDILAACAHPRREGKGTKSRGRDPRPKRLGCCAGLGFDNFEPGSDGSGSFPDLVEIPGVVGAERSKHKKCRQRLDPNKYARMVGANGGAVNERDRKDYFTPSTELFHDFVQEDVVQRYGLSTEGNWPCAAKALAEDADLHREEEKPAACEQTDPAEGTTPQTPTPALTLKGEVESLRWSKLHIDGWDQMDGFFLQTTDGARIGAKAVVSAVGPAGKPSIPHALLDARDRQSEPAARHCSATADVNPSTSSDDGAAEAASQRPASGLGDKPPSASKAPAAESRPKTTSNAPCLFGPGWCHTAALAHAPTPLPPPSLTARPGPKTLVVVGGGLTSAQICDVALRTIGFAKVYLLLRGHLKVKPFDITLDWMGRYSNLRKMQFWQEEDPVARLAMIRSARQGGSMTPPYAKLMKRYEEAGVLEVMTHTELKDAEWSETNSKWSLSLGKNVPADPRAQAKAAFEAAKAAASETGATAANSRAGDECLCDGIDSGKASSEGTGVDAAAPTASEEPEPVPKAPDLEADYIITASAFQPGFDTLPFMRDLSQQYPIRHEGGLPLVSEHLQYGDLPLFVVGMYAGLQIGPAAGNLGGIREAADRVVSRLESLIEPPPPVARSSAAEAPDCSDEVDVENDGDGQTSRRGGNGMDTEKALSAMRAPIDGTLDGHAQGTAHFNFEALALEG